MRNYIKVVHEEIQKNPELVSNPNLLIFNDKVTKRLSRKLDDYDKSFVYFISDGELTKIGITRSLEQRIKKLQTGNGRKLFVQAVIVCKDTAESEWLELLLHQVLDKYHKLNEWFDLRGFDLKPYIMHICKCNTKRFWFCQQSCDDAK